MAEFNLKIIKIFFVAMILSLVIVMASGITIFKNDLKLSKKYLKMEMAAWSYKHEYQKKYQNVVPAGSVELGNQASAAQSHLAHAFSVPALLYHGVIEDPSRKPDDTNISLSAFKEQMFALKAAGYNTVSLADFNDFMKGKKDLPAKSFLLTFDDGRSDSYWPVDPILKALDFKAVMFVITGHSFSGKENFYLSENEMREMAQSGRWEIESHGRLDHDWYKIAEDGTQGHFLSNRIWIAGENRLESEDEYKNRVAVDLAGAKQDIEKRIGKPVLGFAFPFNDFGQDSQNFPDAENYIRKVVGLDYPLSFYQFDSDNVFGNYPDPGENKIKRLDINSSVNSRDLANFMQFNEEKELPYTDNFSQNNGWMTSWGDARFGNGLEIGNEKNLDSGNLTFLAGSRSWENYLFSAKIKADASGSNSLVVRLKDTENYASCEFTDEKITLSATVGGIDTIISEKLGSFNLPPGQDFSPAVKVSGNLASCYLNGQPVIEGNIPDSLDKGGVGFKMWTADPGNDWMAVREATIEKI
jgi:peptidoglycan/xylan/chitin deacetylase (PgdA/CDA1 family)